MGVPVPPEVSNPGKLVIYGPQQVMLTHGVVDRPKGVKLYYSLLTYWSYSS